MAKPETKVVKQEVHRVSYYLKMNEFDIKAAGWDMNPMHIARSEAIARQIIERIPLKKSMSALEFGAGTGITSFLLKDHLGKIIMMDNSAEMLKIMNEKIHTSGAQNIKAILFDLEKQEWIHPAFDIIFNQMVLHHISDISAILKKFYNLLNPGGYLAIADLYPEDGSFHGKGFQGYKGFDLHELSTILGRTGFKNITSKKCFEINKHITDKELKQFDLFLLIAERGNTQN